MTDETADQKPLIPKSPVATGTVVVSVASILTVLGWVGQKLLDVDEKQVAVTKSLQIVEEEIAEHHKDRIGLAQDVVRLQEEIKSLKEEQNRLRKANENRL